MEVQIQELKNMVDINICFMPNGIVDALKLSIEIPYKIHLGQNYEYSYVIPNEEFDKCMYLSKSLFKKLLLFEGITLNIWRNEDGIYLGPVVGMFVDHRRTTAIRIGKPSFLIQKHAEAGSKTNCLSYYYSIEGINWNKGKIKGYTFVRSSNKWRYDWFPMPDVLYDKGKKFSIYQKPYVRYMRHQFRANEVHFINSKRHLGKWKVHECLSKYPDLTIYLPKTIIYRSFNDILSMLNEYKFVFVKASGGYQGKQVLSIEQIDKEYKLTFNKHGLKEIIFKEIEDVRMFTEKFVKGRQFVVQQGIRLIKYNGRNMDLRVLMMRDRQGKWEAVQHHCRIAKETYTITNCALGADCINYEEVYPFLSSPFKRSIPDKEELVNATLKILYYFEKEFGSFGEVGMDMAVDIYGDIWFIEANIRPDKMPSPYDLKELPAEVVNIFEYAKFLTSNVAVYT